MSPRRTARGSASSAAVAVPAATGADPPPNPYVGPRPFRRGELFRGRDREARSVVNSLLASRVMLLHSPSGAGKTSLVQTSVVPAFEKRGFLICATPSPFGALRVNLPPKEGLPVANRYVFSVVNGLIGDFTEETLAATMTLSEAIDAFARRHKAEDKRKLLLLDQFEEILTLEPADIEGQSAFFEQLGDALDDSHRWALLAIREDYMGALDRFQRWLPGQLRSTFRLDLLDVPAALLAVRDPARERHVEFEEEAARALVHDLAEVHSGSTAEGAARVQHPYVEPVLLQVVCYSLFERISQDWEARDGTITVADVEAFKPFDKSIAMYYQTVLSEVANGDTKLEQALRDWVAHHLIGRKRLRRQTRRLPAVPDAGDLLDEMRSRYLIRDDPRPGGAPLWELTHDMLIGPVLENNRAWRAAKLQSWQCQAEDWRASKRDPRYLLRGADYRAAPSVKHRAAFTDNETAFLKESDRAFQADMERVRAEGHRALLMAQLRMFRGLLTASVVGNILLLIVVVILLTKPL